MIAESEIRRFAAHWHIDPMVVDLDYALGWFLAAMHSTGELASRLRFKGGTCLRKCYFADHRFSEDLDFTATAYLAPNALLDCVERAALWAVEHDGPNFTASATRLKSSRTSTAASHTRYVCTIVVHCAGAAPHGLSAWT